MVDFGSNPNRNSNLFKYQERPFFMGKAVEGQNENRHKIAKFIGDLSPTKQTPVIGNKLREISKAAAIKKKDKTK